MVSAVAATSGALPQSRVWRIGWLLSTSMKGPNAGYFQSLKDELVALGYVEGQNVIFITGEAEGQFDRLPAIAREIVEQRPDIIIAAATPAVAAAQRATSAVPIVMAPATDPLGSGFVQSLARPGGNITGVSNMTADLTAKALEFLRFILPNAIRIGVLMSANPVHPTQLRQAEAAAPVLEMRLIPITAKAPEDVEKAFRQIAEERCDALLVLADPIRPTIVDFANRARLATIYQLPEFVRAGGLISYGPSFHHLFRRAGSYVDRILKGAAPADLPVEQPTKFELVINLKTAKAFGLEIPPALLARADEVIE
jgi:putative ABC transport system substrate-binding protein